MIGGHITQLQRISQANQRGQALVIIRAAMVMQFYPEAIGAEDRSITRRGFPGGCQTFRF